ncbi:glycosyltransferase [Rhizobium tubonense]|uniref:Glycosyl transferase n=1 Tax=Rhizobium tubonense TaxID=484088 RepID=A0A2W4EME7_9HYPH|nr:glycosyltransferase [Rhizobium tubonense]PZM14876.1 hypothetical protein CPY51_09275 [Rhizobium tubonense]
MQSSSQPPKISIVTPSLNQGRFLQQCLDSVAAQNWGNLEHFVIDGGSTDDSLEILKRNDQLTSFVSERDSGAAHAINKGLAKCTGDIVAWLNADDFYLPGAFEELAAKWREKPDASFWFGNGLRVDEAGKTKAVFNPGPIIYNRDALIEGLDYILQPATFMNPKVLKEAGGLNIDLRWSFDWELWIRLAELAPPATIDVPLAASREWGATLTANGGFRRAEELRLMAERYSGKATTHGAVSYWLDTLVNAMKSDPSLFKGDVQSALHEFWCAVQSDMQRLSVNTMGMPTSRSAEPERPAILGDLFPRYSGASDSLTRRVKRVLRKIVRLVGADRPTTSHQPKLNPLPIKEGDIEIVSFAERPQPLQSGIERLVENANDIARHPGEIERLVIGVDLFPLNAGTSGGIVPWVKGVLREMVRLYPMDRVVLFHRPGPPPLLFEGENVEFVPLAEHPVAFYSEMARHCEYLHVRAIIRTYPQEHHPNIPFERQIFVIPDIQHEFFPEFFAKDVLAARRRAFAYALSCGGAIATMTDHSRATLVKNGWTITDDVFLMPAALPEELRAEPADGALPEKARAFDRFFYMPANIWLHKNHHRLFEAFRDVQPLLPPNTGLVLTGSPDGFIDAIKGFEDLPIVHLGFVPHEQVAALFREAVALVYFSLFEGFGMPLLEAFNHGTPVLCSNAASLPEVGGDAVLSCDPTDVRAMTQLMSRIVNEEGLRECLSAKAAKRLAAYNWATPAHSLRAALNRVAHAPTREKRRPLLSIVMPTRNHAHFIRASIDSVLSQSYENVELVVMDGASTDETVEILKSYGDKIRWISEPDKGQADAINKGMQKVGGDILAYLNSDDILLPGALEKAVAYFNDHPECDMIYGNADYIDEDGNITGLYTTAEFTFERLMQDCCVCQPAAFWRRRIAERTGPFNAELQTAMDYDYWLRIASGGGIIRHTSEKLAQSRLHKDAKTLAMRGKIFEEVFDICEEHGGYVSYSYYNGLWSYRLYESWAGGATFRRILPRAYRLPAMFHFSSQLVRIRRKRHNIRSVARTVFSVVDRRSPAIGTVLRKAWRRSSTLRRGFS